MGVVVGTGGGVTPSAHTLHRNFAFSSHFITSHNPPAIPVLMATQPCFLPGCKQECTKATVVGREDLENFVFYPDRN